MAGVGEWQQVDSAVRAFVFPGQGAQLALAGLILTACVTEPVETANSGQVKPTQLELQAGLRPGEYGIYSSAQVAQIISLTEDQTWNNYWKIQRQIDLIKARPHNLDLG